MSYQMGQMGLAEGIALVYIVTFNRIFLTPAVQTLDNSASLAWLEILLAGMIMFGVLWLMILLLKQYPGDVLDVAEHLLGRAGAWAIGLYYSCLFFINAVLLLRQFSENTLLTALPEINFILIIVLYGFVVAVIVYLGIEPIARAAYVILPFGVGSLVIVLLLLAPLYNIYFLAPWQGTGLGSVAAAGLAGVGNNIGAILLLVIAPAFQNLHTVRNAAIFGLGLSVILKCFSILVFCMVFGIAAGREKVLPFFEMARLVYLGHYLQRIEALYIMLWVINGVFDIAVNAYMGLYLLSRLLRLPALRPLLPIVMIILVELGMLPSDIVTVIELNGRIIKTYFDFGVYGIPAILLIAAWFKRRQKGGKVCANG